MGKDDLVAQNMLEYGRNVANYTGLFLKERMRGDGIFAVFAFNEVGFIKALPNVACWALLQVGVSIVVDVNVPKMAGALLQFFGFYG